MYYRDWFVTQIRAAIQMLAQLMFKRDDITYEIRDDREHTDTDLLFLRLCALLAENNINEAENLLFDMLDTNDRGHLRLALDFFNRVNNMSDDELEAANYSREEISNGVDDIKSLFGIFL